MKFVFERTADAIKLIRKQVKVTQEYTGTSYDCIWEENPNKHGNNFIKLV